MTLDDLERQNKGFMDFWRFGAATQVYIIQGGVMQLSLCDLD